MISQLLAYKILQLFVIMIFGYILVKAKVLKGDDGIILSKLSLYMFMPAVIIKSFNMEITDEIAKGLIISFATAVLIHLVLMVVDLVLKRCFKATSVERASAVYSNAANLIIPIVAYVFGEEWVIYSSGYIIVQLIFLWTHGVRLFSDDKFSFKKILLNVNMIAIVAGFVLMLSGLRLPAFAEEVVSSLGDMLAPAGMIIAGMLAARVDFRKALKSKRLYFVAAVRLIICPVIIMALVKAVLAVVDIPNAETVMLISYFSSISPTASTIMQLAQIYGKDDEYAITINVVTTVACVITMPLLIMFF